MASRIVPGLRSRKLEPFDEPGVFAVGMPAGQQDSDPDADEPVPDGVDDEPATPPSLFPPICGMGVTPFMLIGLGTLVATGARRLAFCPLWHRLEAGGNRRAVGGSR